MSLTSETWRLRGNENFVKAKHNKADQAEQYGSALLCYKHAMDLAKTDIQYSSAAKNAATTSRKLAEFYHNTQLWNRYDRLKYEASALEFYSKAKFRGFGHQSETWMTNIRSAFKSSLREASNLADEFHGEEKAKVLQSLVKEIVKDNSKRLWLLKAVDILYNEAKSTDDESRAKDMLQDAIKPLERAKSLGALTVHWEDSIDEERRIVSARIEFKRANTILKDATEHEPVNADLLFVAIDTFINSIKLSEEAKQEVEAKAYSKLGEIHEKYLKNVDRAKTYHRKCVYIADNILPKSFLQHEWYISSTEALKRYQKKAVDDTEDAEYQERKEQLEDLKEELNKMKEKAKHGIPKLIEFITKEFPPKGKPFNPLTFKELNILDNQALRKEVLKLVLKYHPDKQTDQDKRWKVLCEEITKQMNKMLENLKCCS